MARRPWIKTHCDRWLRGSIRAEPPFVRAALHDLNNMGGDSAYGDLGRVQLAPDVGLTDEGFAGVLNFPVDEWREAIRRLQPKWIRIEPLKVGYAVVLLHWGLQSDYNRQKPYRLRGKLQRRLHPRLQDRLQAENDASDTPGYRGEVEVEGEEGKGVLKEVIASSQLGSESLQAGRAKGPTDPIERARASKHPVEALVSGLANSKSVDRVLGNDPGDG